LEHAVFLRVLHLWLFVEQVDDGSKPLRATNLVQYNSPTPRDFFDLALEQQNVVLIDALPRTLVQVGFDPSIYVISIARVS